MTPNELVLVILVTCGKGFSHQAQDCRDLMVNCSINQDSTIDKEKVEKCAERAKSNVGS